jgi:hypothetical protein
MLDQNDGEPITSHEMVDWPYNIPGSTSSSPSGIGLRTEWHGMFPWYMYFNHSSPNWGDYLVRYEGGHIPEIVLRVKCDVLAYVWWGEASQQITGFVDGGGYLYYSEPYVINPSSEYVTHHIQVRPGTPASLGSNGDYSWAVINFLRIWTESPATVYVSSCYLSAEINRLYVYDPGDAPAYGGSGGGPDSTPGSVPTGRNAFPMFASGACSSGNAYVDITIPGAPVSPTATTASSVAAASYNATTVSGVASPKSVYAEKAAGLGSAGDATTIAPDVSVDANVASSVGKSYGSFDGDPVFSATETPALYNASVELNPYPAFGSTTVNFLASYSTTTTFDYTTLDLDTMVWTPGSATLVVPAPSDTLYRAWPAGSDKILQVSYYYDTEYHWLLTLHDLDGTNLGTLDFGGAGNPVYGSYTPLTAAARDGSGAEYLLYPDYESGTFVTRIWNVSGPSPSMTPLVIADSPSGGYVTGFQHISTGGWTTVENGALYELMADGTYTELISNTSGGLFYPGEYPVKRGTDGWLRLTWNEAATSVTVEVIDETATTRGSLILSGIDPDFGLVWATDGPIYHSGRWWFQLGYSHNWETLTPPDEMRLYSCGPDGTVFLEDAVLATWGPARVVPLDAMRFMSMWRRDAGAGEGWEAAYDFIFVRP